MSLAEIKLVGFDAHHPTAPLAKRNGAEGARRPPRLLRAWHHRRGATWRRRSTGCSNLGLEFRDILLNDRGDGATFAYLAQGFNRQTTAAGKASLIYLVKIRIGTGPGPIQEGQRIVQFPVPLLQNRHVVKGKGVV